MWLDNYINPLSGCGTSQKQSFCDFSLIKRSVVRTISSNAGGSYRWFKINADPELLVPWQACSVTDPFIGIYV